MLLRDASNSMDILRQRRADSKHSSSTTMSSTPLTDVDSSNHEYGHNGTPTAGMTTFLPTLHSTPPMPTFQKPGMRPCASLTSTPSSHIIRRVFTPGSSSDDIAFDPLHSHPLMSTTTSPDASSRATDPQPPIFARRRENIRSENERPRRIYIPHRSPETIDGYERETASGATPSHIFYSRGSKAYTTTPLIDRIPDTPPFPNPWNTDMDRLICKLDVRGYDHARIVKKVRQQYPQLGGVLTASMIDRRLRQLDQDIEIDYWRAEKGSQKPIEVRQEERAKDLRDRAFTPEGYRAHMAAASEKRAQEEQEQYNTLQQQQGEQRHQDWSMQYASTVRARDLTSPQGVMVRCGAIQDCE